MSFEVIMLSACAFFCTVGFVATFARFLKGPSLPDRVVSLDLLTTIGVAIIAVYAIRTREPVMIDVALIIGIISFLGTIAFAYYIQRSTTDDHS